MANATHNLLRRWPRYSPVFTVSVYDQNTDKNTFELMKMVSSVRYSYIHSSITQPNERL